VKPKPTHADLAGSRYLALQRLARAQKRTTADLLQLYVLESFLRRLVRSRHDHTCRAVAAMAPSAKPMG
jgi:hypothetical protein